MKKAFGLFVVLMTLVAFQGIASAKTVSGKVAGIDAAAGTLSVNVADPATGSEEKADIAVNAATAYTGIAALADLKEGQEVAVEASEDTATGGWVATSVSIPAAAPAQEPAA